MPKEKLTVTVFFENLDGDLIKMPDFSKWFTQNKINPMKGEQIFIPEFDKKDEGCEFYNESMIANQIIIIFAKFYDPAENNIDVWCKDWDDKK